MFEYDGKLIKEFDDGAKAVLTIIANQSEYGQRFKCLASNEHGESEKYFTLMKMEKPKKPEKVCLSLFERILTILSARKVKSA